MFLNIWFNKTVFVKTLTQLLIIVLFLCYANGLNHNFNTRTIINLTHNTNSFIFFSANASGTRLSEVQAPSTRRSHLVLTKVLFRCLRQLFKVIPVGHVKDFVGDTSSPIQEQTGSLDCTIHLGLANSSE